MVPSLDSLRSVIAGYTGKRAGLAAFIATEFKTSERSARRWLRNMDDTKPVCAGTVDAPDVRRSVLSGSRFVITTAQNNTKAHGGFLKSLEKYCEHNKAQLLVVRCTYNKHGFQNLEKSRKDLWYDKRLEPYLIDSKSYRFQANRCENLVLCAELDILPTAERPLSGLTNYSRAASCIVPHVKLAMESVPTDLGFASERGPKLMYTTGVVTQRNYIQRKAGQKADFHHVYGAVVLEFSGDKWFVRQLVASTHGGFYDLTDYYSPEGVSHGHRVKSLVLGDLHLPHPPGGSPHVTAVFGETGLLAALKPEYMFLHDLIDFKVENHHNRKSGMWRMQTAHTTVSDELDDARDQLCALVARCHEAIPDGTEINIVWSNHMDALLRWLDESDWREQRTPRDAMLLLRLQHKALEILAKPGPEKAMPNFRAMCDMRLFMELFKDIPATWLHRGTPGVINGVAHGMHGHLGPGGSRGNPGNLNKIGVKATIGHGHAARILDGVYQVGVMCPTRLGYNEGPNNWSHTHCIMYPNGKRAMITTVGEAWRG